MVDEAGLIMALTFGSLFAGIGGFDLGFERAGMVCKWQVEIDPYANKVLAKHWPNVRRHDDIRTFPPVCKPCCDFLEQFRCNAPDECDCPKCQGLCGCDDWRVDVICGGFPCQDISYAGRGAGLAGARSGLFYEAIRVIGALGPRIVVLENVAALLNRGMDAVLGTLSSIGFDVEWSVIPACAFGAPHARERVFLIAHRNEVGRRLVEHPDGHDAICERLDAWKASPDCSQWRDVQRWISKIVADGGGIIPSAERGGMANGIPNRMDRIGACGNAVVPQVAEYIGRKIVEAV